MMDKEIKKAVESGDILISPFSSDRLQGASYDLAVGPQALVSNSDTKILLSETNQASIRLNAGDFALVLTKEKIKLPLNIAGHIGMRSSLARKGLSLLAGMQIDPGFEGHLRFGLYNSSPRPIILDYDDPLCMIELHRLVGDVDKPQPRIQELIDGKIPESDRDFLRSLETTSLSDLSKNLRELTQTVSRIAKEYEWINKIIVGGIIAIFIGVVTSIILGIYKK
ncbi:MAG: dCTP deaminase [Sedimentisphaerales bacterium]